MSRSPRSLVAGFACFAIVLVACSGSPEPAARPDPVDPVDDGSVPPTSEPIEDDPDPATGDSDPNEGPSLEPAPVPLDNLSDQAGEIVLLDADEQVIVSQPDGTSARTLSEPGTSNSQPTWSTSGERVAWSSFGGGGAMLSTARSDGSEPVSLAVSRPPFYLSWSPDDTWIGGLRPTGAGMEMFVANQSAVTERVVSEAQPFYFDWVNDDAIIAALGGQLLVDVSASDAVDPLRRPLQNPLGAFQAPAVLPNGDVIIALNIEGDNTLVRVSGNTSTVIGTANSPMFLAASPDGRRIAVLVRPNDGAQQPQSEVIAFQFDEPVELESGRVTIIDLETGDVEIQPEEQPVSMSWSPDSTTLALLAFDGAGLQWSFNTPNGQVAGASFSPSPRFAQRYLPFFDQYNLSATSWSPTSDAIVFAGTIADETGIFVDVVSDDFGPALIATGEVAFWSPR